MTHERRPGRDDALGERRERLLEQQAALASHHAGARRGPRAHVHECDLDFARQRSIGALREHAERLAALDRMHAAFAARVRAYLDSFQMKKLRQWLEQIDRR
jgi:hypothetical protein